MRVASIRTEIERVPAGTVAVAVRESSTVSDCRSSGVTGPATSVPSAPDAALRNVAVTAAESACVRYPPSSADSVAGTPPRSICAAAPATLTTCVAELAALSGPPAKKLAPPPHDAPSSVVGNAGAPYATSVNGPSVVHPGGATTVVPSADPATASASPLVSRFPLGTCAPAVAGTIRTASARAARRRIHGPSHRSPVDRNRPGASPRVAYPDPDGAAGSRTVTRSPPAGRA